MACAISSLIYKVRGRDRPDQSKPQVGKSIHNVTLKLTLTVSTVLVLQTLFLILSLCLKKNRYLAVLVEDELSTVHEHKPSDFAISHCSEINTICSDYGSLLGVYTV